MISYLAACKQLQSRLCINLLDHFISNNSLKLQKVIYVRKLVRLTLYCLGLHRGKFHSMEALRMEWVKMESLFHMN